MEGRFESVLPVLTSRAAAHAARIRRLCGTGPCGTSPQTSYLVLASGVAVLPHSGAVVTQTPVRRAGHNAIHRGRRQPSQHLHGIPDAQGHRPILIENPGLHATSALPFSPRQHASRTAPTFHLLRREDPDGDATSHQPGALSGPANRRATLDQRLAGSHPSARLARGGKDSIANRDMPGPRSGSVRVTAGTHESVARTGMCPINGAARAYRTGSAGYPTCMKPGCTHLGRASFLLTGPTEPGVAHCMECMQSWPANIAPLDLINRLAKHIILLADTRNAELN